MDVPGALGKAAYDGNGSPLSAWLYFGRNSARMSEQEPQTREVLIVDDSQPTALALAKLLIRDGFEVAVYTNGSDALSYLNVGRPAAAVVDIHLPDISGLAISQHIRQNFGAELPIIIISGDSSMDNINSLSMVGATYFYSKPVKAADLIKRLRELVSADAAS